MLTFHGGLHQQGPDDGAAGRGDAEQAGQPVLQEPGEAEGVAVLGSDAAGEPADGEAGAPGREAGVGLGGQVRSGYGENGLHRGAHGKPGGDQEDVWGGEPSPVASSLHHLFTQMSTHHVVSSFSHWKQVRARFCCKC